MVSRTELIDRAGCDLFAESLRAGRTIRMRAGGSSMIPALWPGDELLVTPLAAERSPAPGEIVLFMRDGRLFAHRVVAAVGDVPAGHLITRGDALDRNDPPIAPSEVLGAVAAVFRDGRELACGAMRPSLIARLFALAFRRIDLLRRVALRAHSVRWRLRGGKPITAAKIAAARDPGFFAAL
jgi:signal peptidase I